MCLRRRKAAAARRRLDAPGIDLRRLCAASPQARGACKGRDCRWPDGRHARATGGTRDRTACTRPRSPVKGSYSITRGCTVGPPSAAAAASAIAACYAEMNPKDQHTKAGMQQVNGAALQGPVLSPLPLAVPPPPPPLHDWCTCRIVMHPRHHDREHPVACTTGICLPGTGTTLAHFAWGAACAHVAPPPGPSRSALC